MRKNKMCLRMVLAAALLSPALPVWANTLTDTNYEGNTTVTADVANGNVSYTISIPDTIDFGKLTPPADNNDSHMAEVEYTVGATQVDGLDSKTSRVAVLMKDAAAGPGFQITGQGPANTGKTLSYSVLNASNSDISEQTLYANGYLLAAFEAANQNVTGKLQLDQNQLYGQNLSAWAGKYQGTIKFFSKIATLEEFNLKDAG